MTNCGQNADGSPSTDFTTNIVSGSDSLATPNYQCYFNQTGIFNIRLYLQDTFNTDNYSEYNENTISIQVIDGVSGSTCNVGDELITIPDETPVAPTTSEETTISDDLLGGDEKLLLILGLIVVIVVTGIVGYYIKSELVVLATAFFSVMAMTFIGWLPPTILIISLIGLALLLVFFLTMKPSNPVG